MNIEALVSLWLFIIGFSVMILVFANPFFQSKKLLKITFIPLVAFIVLLTYAVGWIY